jgi:hypothetical protein
VAVRQPRVRDRAGDGCERIRFSPNILPRYARRTKSLEALLPILYLKGVSTGDFEEALAALVGRDAPGLSASTIARLKEAWSEEHDRWRKQTANVLNKLPKSLHAKAKRALQEIWMAETKKDAVAAFDAFAETYGAKYDKAVECLTKDRDALLAFYDFPAEHWKHLRTTDEMDKHFLYDEQTSWKAPVRPFFCSTAPPAFFRPDRPSHSRRAQGRSRLAASCAAAARLGLDRPEHGGRLDRIGTGKTPMAYRARRSMA